MSGSRRDFRYDRAEEVWLGRCPSCASAGQTEAWWPLDLIHWEPTSGLQKCRACHRLVRRRRRRQTVEERRAKQRAYYHEHRDQRLAWRKAYHAANRERINAERRAKYAAKKAQGETLWEMADAPQDT